MKTIRTVPEIWNYERPYSFTKKFIVYKDSLKVSKLFKKADIRTNYEIAQKQIEVDLLNQQKQIKRQY
jgi:hypothetical protein